MNLTPSDVHWIDVSGHPWPECIVMHGTYFHNYVAKVTSKMDRFDGAYKMKNELQHVKVSKNGVVELYALNKRGEFGYLRAADQHVFLRHPIGQTFEYDIFEGRQNKGRWNAMEETFNELGAATQGWRLQRLSLDHYGDGKHALFIIFQDEMDMLLFAPVFEYRLQKAGLKQGRRK